MASGAPGGGASRRDLCIGGSSSGGGGDGGSSSRGQGVSSPVGRQPPSEPLSPVKARAQTPGTGGTTGGP
ncbi:hypothetical protein ACP70R_024519 [Stipagrostis hirtigluma subsp. patula]